MSQRILKSTATVSIMRMAGIGLQFLWFILLVRWLPMEDVGIYSVINSLWIIMRALGACGADQAIIKEGALLAAQQDKGALRSMVHYAIMRSLRVILPIMVCMAAIASLTLDDTRFSLSLYIWISMCGIAYMLFSIGSSLLLAHEKQLAAHGLESLILPTSLILCCSIAYVTDSLTLQTLLTLQSITALCIAGGYLMLMHRLLGRSSTPLGNRTRAHFNLLSWRLFGTIAFNNLNIRLPILCAPFIIGTAQTALLEMALRFASLLGIVQWCAAFVIAPKLSKLDKNSDKQTMQSLLVTGCWIVFVPALGLFCGFIVLGHWLLGIAGGDAYHAAYPPLIIMALGFLCNASSGATTHYYMMLGHEKQALRISFMETLAVLVMLPIGGMTFGLEGLALAMALGLALRNIWLNTQLESLTGLYSGIWSLRGWQQGRYLATHYREIL